MTTRLLLDVAMEPAIGSRFQPTGFPDIGAADFQRPSRDGAEPTTCLLVESAQSMANHLEAVAWDPADEEPVDLLAALPYVRVVAESDGRFLTSSRLEAHRLASAFVKDSTLDGVSMVDVLRERLGLRDDTPVPLRQIASAVFALDPMCLVHGVFFADNRWPGQPKIARALTAFVEAVDVRRADSGGVKRDHVRHKLNDSAGGTAEGYGSVPFHRTEWTAATITASFALDRRQLHSYGLGDDAARLLESLALWEVRALLDDGMRLRTACDFVPSAERIVDRSDQELPSVDELATAIGAGIAACQDQLGHGGPMEVRWSDTGKRKKS